MQVVRRPSKNCADQVAAPVAPAAVAPAAVAPAAVAPTAVAPKSNGLERARRRVLAMPF